MNCGTTLHGWMVMCVFRALVSSFLPLPLFSELGLTAFYVLIAAWKRDIPASRLDRACLWEHLHDDRIHFDLVGLTIRKSGSCS